MRPPARPPLATIALLPLIAAGAAGCVSYGTGAAGLAKPAAINRVKTVTAASDGSRAHAAKPRRITQLITVTADSYSTTYARFVAYRWARRHWVKVFGPWTARVGYNGIARPGAKREGDGKTPSGRYGFEFDFGVLANPGVAVKYRRARSYDWWDDDPSSRNYNEWVDTRYRDPGRNPEPMDNQPAYNYGAVIAYNTKRVGTPPLGSAIFLHVGTGSSTAGCVSLPQRKLLKVLLWLRPADHPRIAISVRT